MWLWCIYELLWGVYLSTFIHWRNSNLRAVVWNVKMNATCYRNTGIMLCRWILSPLLSHYFEIKSPPPPPPLPIPPPLKHEMHRTNTTTATIIITITIIINQKWNAHIRQTSANYTARCYVRVRLLPAYEKLLTWISPVKCGGIHIRAYGYDSIAQ